MKTTLLLIFSFALFQVSFAQNFSFVEGDTTMLNVTEFDPNVADYVVHNKVVNTGTDTLNLRWIRSEIAFPSGWSSAICDINLCYLDWIDSVEFDLNPGIEGRMDAHFHPNEIFGEGTIHLLVKNVNDPSEYIEGVYIFDAEKVTGNVELDYSDLKVFPNPTANFFMLNNPGPAKRIDIINVVGRQMKSFNVERGKQYDISDLSDGYYIVKMTDQQGKLLKSVRLSKR